MKAKEATYGDVRKYLMDNGLVTFTLVNDDIYDFLDWTDTNIFDNESLDSAWKRYNSVDFQGDCV